MVADFFGRLRPVYVEKGEACHCFHATCVVRSGQPTVDVRILWTHFLVFKVLNFPCSSYLEFCQLHTSMLFCGFLRDTQRKREGGVDTPFWRKHVLKNRRKTCLKKSFFVGTFSWTFGVPPFEGRVVVTCCDYRCGWDNLTYQKHAQS